MSVWHYVWRHLIYMKAIHELDEVKMTEINFFSPWEGKKTHKKQQQQKKSVWQSRENVFH